MKIQEFVDYLKEHPARYGFYLGEHYKKTGFFVENKRFLTLTCFFNGAILAYKLPFLLAQTHHAGMLSTLLGLPDA